MGPGNYGLFPVYFLPISWPHYSLAIMGKCVQLIIYKILPSFLIRFPPQFLILIGLHRMYNDVGLAYVPVEGPYNKFTSVFISMFLRSIVIIF